ncbi:MAG: SEL1-like repeat protein [Thermoguttaceae bacterium]|nr:SEL1-like repeat protein [Thermoguttaceae bacterium]
MKSKNNGARRATALALLAAALGFASWENVNSEGVSANETKIRAALARANGGEDCERDKTELLYRRGRAWAFGLEGRRIDAERGARLLQEAANAGSLAAQAERAELNLSERCRYDDCERSFNAALEAAEAGNPFAIRVVAVCYENGLSVEKDEERAAALYKLAFQGFKELADSDARAKFNLGRCYWEGKGAARDPRAAVRWFLEAEKAGSALARGALSVCYFQGEGVERDVKEAVRWLRLGAERGDVRAALTLGVCCENGVGTQASFAEASRYYRDAAEAGSGEAARRLGRRRYLDGDYAAAVRWFRKAAKNGDELANYYLSLCYENGEGVEKDAKKAEELYRSVFGTKGDEEVASVLASGESDCYWLLRGDEENAEGSEVASQEVAASSADAAEVAIARWLTVASQEVAREESAEGSSTASEVAARLQAVASEEVAREESAKGTSDASEVAARLQAVASEAVASEESAEGTSDASEVAARLQAVASEAVASEGSAKGSSDASEEVASEEVAASSSDASENANAVVSGVATLDGRPLANATLRFVAIGGADVSATVVVSTNERGEYESRLEAGEYFVTAVCFKRVETGGVARDENGEEIPEVEWRNVVPTRYVAPSRVGLKATIAQGENTRHFEMKSND